jgi:hypothetical protein
MLIWIAEPNVQLFACPLRISWARPIRDALFQAIRIGAAAFAVINIAVGIKVDVRIGPLWGYVDAVRTHVFAPPRDFHKKIIVRKQEAVIDCASAGLHPSLVYPVLDIPDIPELFPSIFGVMNGYGRKCNIPVANSQIHTWNP